MITCTLTKKGWGKITFLYCFTKNLPCCYWSSMFDLSSFCLVVSCHWVCRVFWHVVRVKLEDYLLLENYSLYDCTATNRNKQIWIRKFFLCRRKILEYKVQTISAAPAVVAMAFKETIFILCLFFNLKSLYIFTWYFFVHKILQKTSSRF